VDMRGVNQFMKPIHFKIEGTPTLEQLLMKNDFAISYNLKEAYNHVPVHPQCRIYWEYNIRVDYTSIRECLSD
jgi:hypothetical protein